MKQKTSGRVGHNVRAHHNSSSCARVCAAHIMTGSLNATPAERKLSECLDANDSGAADSAGHRCGFYNNHSTVCGANDDSDFSASAICCACGGGAQVATPSASPTAFSTTTPEATLSPTAASAETSCADSNNGATDPYGDGCEYYETYPGDCGGYDDDDFNSVQMCCACGGGVAPTANPTVAPGPSPIPTVSEEPTVTLAPTTSEIHVSTHDELSDAIESEPSNERQRVIKVVGDIEITTPIITGEGANIKVAGANATKRARISPAAGSGGTFLKAGDAEEVRGAITRVAGRPIACSPALNCVRRAPASCRSYWKTWRSMDFIVP